MDLDRFDPAVMPGDFVSIDGHQAYNPDPLPPDLELTPDLFSAVAAAQKELSELAGIGRTLKNPHMLIQPFIRQEAVLSSRIEGTQAELSDVLALEAGEERFVDEPRRIEVREVQNYVVAMERSLEALNHGPISMDLIRSAHRTLLSGVRGDEKRPGEFRDRQNFIAPPGVDTPRDARFVPPPASAAHYGMRELEAFIQTPSPYPDLIDIALVHYQLETIHPFLDGNGRIGRLLITLMLCERGLLPTPLLYLSAYFNRNREEYFNRLFDVSATNSWEPWLVFFLHGIRTQATEAFTRSNALYELHDEYVSRYQTTKSTTILQLIDLLFSRPMFTVTKATEEIGDKTYQAVNNAVNQLEADGVLTEVTGKEKNRLFQATEILNILHQPVHELRDVGTDIGRQADLGEY